jgi:hypothetical protein
MWLGKSLLVLCLSLVGLQRAVDGECNFPPGLPGLNPRRTRVLASE